VSWLEGILLGIVAIAAVIDFRTRRIPNWLTLSAVLLGLVFQGVTHGLPGLLAALLGVLVGAGLFFIPFALGGMGPGDVKLMAAVGAFLGPKGALWAVLMTGVAGGVLVLVWALVHGRLGRTLQRTGSLVGAAVDPRRRAAQGGMPTLEKNANWSIPYGVAIAVGVALSLWWRSV
jgi:prepilin peptidase CpaA